MSPAFGTRLPVGVFVKILVDAAFAESVEALVDGVGVSKKAIAEGTFQPLMQISLLDFPDESGLPRTAQHLFFTWLTLAHHDILISSVG